MSKPGSAHGIEQAEGGALARLPVFRIRHLSKIYGSGEVQVRALREVDLDVARGEFIVLLGASGSGKSTLLNILGGLDTATSGEVWFGEEDLSAAGEARLTAYRRHHVGFVFQFYNLIPSLTVFENVSLVTDIADDPIRGMAGIRVKFRRNLSNILIFKRIFANTSKESSYRQLGY